MTDFNATHKQPARPMRQPSSYRMERINKQLQREISLLLEQRVKNDIARNAIITGVDCSRDLEFARVCFTTLNIASREPVLTELRNIKGALRSMLGQVLRLRRVPALEFELDRSLDYGERIDGILRDLGLGESVAKELEDQKDMKNLEHNEDDDDEDDFFPGEEDDNG